MFGVIFIVSGNGLLLNPPLKLKVGAFFSGFLRREKVRVKLRF